MRELIAPPKTIEWTGTAARIIDQTLLPGTLKFVDITTDKEMWEAIKSLRVRGAPAIGVAAGYGLVLGLRRKNPDTLLEFRKVLRRISLYLATSRPTAVNLFWALDRCEAAIHALDPSTTAQGAQDRLLAEAIAIHRSDEATCQAIARNGASLLADAKGILTHCNAGALATAGMGTAVGVIYEAARSGNFVVYADETRPLLQGARLTAWELMRAGIETRLITDNMAGTVLSQGSVQAVIVGADRIAANGDTANKIGTMPLAIVANYYKVPVYVAAPMSTIDGKIPDGSHIPIEERSAEEVTELGGTRIAPAGVKVFSPAFDVTPAPLIAAIITEKGVLRAPYGDSIRKALA
jgi:methylthioribose-1-phosphate isomerase